MIYTMRRLLLSGEMRKIILILFFLCLLSVSALAAKSSDFVKISVEGVNFFTHKDLLDSPYIIGSDKVFYGSKNGNVRLKIYLSEKDALGFKNFKIGVRSHRSLIKVTELTIDSKTKIVQNAQYEQDFVYSGLITFGSGLEEIEIELEFDPLEVWIRDEIDIIIYDQQMNIVAVYDPFISGFGNRTKATLNTNGIGLVSDVTRDLTILYHIDATHPFWSSDTCQDNTGYTFAQSDEITELDFDPEDFNITTNDVNVHVETVETFDASTDIEQWFYWNGACVDNSDGEGAYPFSYTMAQHMNQNNVDLFDSTSNNFDLNNVNTPTLREDSQIGKGVKYERANAESSNNNNLLDDGFSSLSVSFWVKKPNQWDSTQPNQHAAFFKANTGDSEDRISLFWRADGTLQWAVINGVTADVMTSSKTIWAANTWFHIVVTFDSGANEMKMYVDSSIGDGGTRSEAMDVVSAGTFANFTLSDSPSFASNEADQTLDEFKVFRNTVLTADEILILFNSESDNLITFGAEEINITDFNVTFNVFQKTGTNFDLDNITIDFNVDAFDATGLTSPFTINDVNAGDYLITISKDMWDANTFFLRVDANSTQTIFIDRFVYPTIAQFTRAADFNSTSINYQTIETFQFATAFGSSSGTDAGCTFWVSTNNGSTRTADFRIQSSDNMVDWITRIEQTRSFSANTAAASIYLATADYNIADGNHFVRIQQKRDVGAEFTINTNDLVCHNFISRDQNNFIVPDTHAQQIQSTASNSFTVLSTTSLATDSFNGFIYQYGDLNYSQTVADGNGVLKFELNGIESAEFPRFISNGSIGIGGHTIIYPDLNQNTSYDVNVLGKTSAGTTAFGYNMHLKHLNQKAGEFADKDLNNLSFSNTSDFEILDSIDLNLSTEGDFRVLGIIPFSCDEANCNTAYKLQIADTTYDVNSLEMLRESGGAGSIGVAIIQYVFEDVNATDVNVNLWAKTTAGTITLKGGSLSVIHANSTTVLTPNPPQPPLIFAPTNGADVNGTIVDYNCFTTDPNSDTLTYDVNIISRDTNAFALNLEAAGDGSDTFDSTALANGTYSIVCTATEVTADAFSASFDNSGYQFTITNILIVPTSAGTGRCETDLETNFYLGQYLQITYSGFDSNGVALTSATFDLFKGQDRLINNQTLIKIEDIFTFVSDKKTDDDPYNLVVASAECRTSDIIRVFSD